MLEQFHYDSDLIGGSLMVRESRLIADLLLREATPEQWHQAIQIDNILQKRTPASAQRNATAIRKRLERLEPDFWKALRDGDDELATQVAFCGALERNLLLLELGWIRKGVKGWELTAQGKALGGVQEEYPDTGVPYVRWPATLPGIGTPSSAWPSVV